MTLDAAVKNQIMIFEDLIPPHLHPLYMSLVPPIRIEPLTDPKHLTAVVELHRKEARYLGFLPRGAFEEHASKKQILTAVGGRKHGFCICIITRHGPNRGF